MDKSQINYSIKAMSIWQNFKANDHHFEKIFFKAIILGAATFLALFLLFKFFDKHLEIAALFRDNSLLLKIFFFTGIGLSVFSFTAHAGALDFGDEETDESRSASLLSSLFWAIFWISWGIYCARITIQFDPLTLAAKLTIAGLLTIPSITAFLISRSHRKDMLQQVEEENANLIESKYPLDSLLATDRKYFSGYFGLLCIPVYLLSLIIHSFL